MELGSPVVTIERRVAALLAISGIALVGGHAHAGRPMATDDAKTVGAQTCQLESWHETTRTSKTDGVERERKMVASPACGIGESIELNVELIRRLPTDGVRPRSTLAFNGWTPLGSWKARAGA